MKTLDKMCLAESPVVRTIMGDVETPVTAYLKTRGIGNSFLLESAQLGGASGRYSFIGFGEIIIKGYPSRVLITKGDSIVEELSTQDPLNEIQDILSVNKKSKSPYPSILGALVGSISYEAVRFVEKLALSNQILKPETEIFRFMLVDRVLVFDHLTGTISIMSVNKNRAEACVEEIIEHLSKPLGRTSNIMLDKTHLTCAVNNEKYKDMILRAKEYIREGDIFQVVLSRQYEGKFDADPFEVYRKLRLLNPSPYMFYFHYSDKQIVGSSPEIHLRIDDGKAFIAPIAGTRPRGKNVVDDMKLETELLGDGKENAEHMMLVDLGRNDLGRVCSPGTINVDRMLAVEKYSHVMHLVSNISGRVAKTHNCIDVLRATFPAGTVSGAPKIRAMDIIDELESSPRGDYAGVVGYMTPSGSMDFCIAIRTMFFERGKVFLRAGAGIVADSIPEKEYEETENKMAVLMAALSNDTMKGAGHDCINR